MIVPALAPAILNSPAPVIPSSEDRLYTAFGSSVAKERSTISERFTKASVSPNGTTIVSTSRIGIIPRLSFFVSVWVRLILP